MPQKQAFIYDWCIVLYDDIYASIDMPERVFALPDDLRPVALFGRISSDPRSNPITGEFADGHRVITSLIIKVEEGRAFTENTCYTLGAMKKEYQEWCASSCRNT